MLYERTGVTRYNRNKATQGYTLFSPMFGKATYIIDMDGNVVHRWKQPALPGAYAYLTEAGTLLGAFQTEIPAGLGLAAKGGHIRELDWKGKLVWEYRDDLQHHDFRRCPNGNTVYVGWELLKRKDQKRVQGGRPGTEHADGIYGDVLREITPGGEIAWEWRVSEHMRIEDYPLCSFCDRREMAHANTVFPLKDGDFMISLRNINVIAIIDRKTKKFKWEMRDWRFGHQHDIQRLDNGNLLLYANGFHGPWDGRDIGSHVFEINPRTKKFVWEYRGQPGFTFDSQTISGVQRLTSGNTLICEGRWGRIFEVTPDGEIVWNYISPYFVTDKKHPMFGANGVFRAFRYSHDSPQIAGRLPKLSKRTAAKSTSAAKSKTRAAKSTRATAPKAKSAAKAKPKRAAKGRRKA
jgi:hypothetical protein